MGYVDTGGFARPSDPAMPLPLARSEGRAQQRIALKPGLPPHQEDEEHASCWHRIFFARRAVRAVSGAATRWRPMHLEQSMRVALFANHGGRGSGKIYAFTVRQALAQLT